MNRSEANRIINAAKNEEKKDKIWAAYKQVWEASVEIPMDSSTFVSLFYEGNLSRDAVKFAGRFRKARELLAKAALRVTPGDLTDSDRQRVFMAVVDSMDYLDHWRQTRNSLDISERRNFSGNIIRIVAKQEGRDRARQTIFELWDEFTLEEEKEYALKELNDAGGLTSSLLRDLGPEAIELVKQMWHRRVIRRLPLDIQPAPVRLSSSVDADKRAVERVSYLLQPVQLRADLRDAGLQPNELSQMSLFPGTLGASMRDYKEFLMSMNEHIGSKHLYHMLEEMEEFGFPFMLSPGLIPQTGANSGTVIQFPLLRILHFREILDSPELSSARMYPERYMVPEIFLHILGVEPVTYFPELRVGNTSERRWRARWAETMGETMSTLFMEAALDIDLTLLERIPEIPSEMTADFKTATKSGELIVYESKGSTDWETHRKQRRKALAQIGKLKSQARQSRDGFERDGRAFACSFYGALQGSSKSTLFHVEDPPFGFNHLFSKGWEEQARRRHYAAVLQFADQFELAEQLLMPEVSPEIIKEQIHKIEPQKFRLKIGDESQEGSLFLGAYDDIESMARKMGFRRPVAFHGWRLFRGINEREFGDLIRRRIPSQQIKDGRYAYFPHTGIIPGGNRGRGRGVYSLLPNGSFLAIEIGQD